MITSSKKNIVILGGGFGGANALLQLQKNLQADADVSVTLPRLVLDAINLGQTTLEKEIPKSNRQLGTRHP